MCPRTHLPLQLLSSRPPSHILIVMTATATTATTTTIMIAQMDLAEGCIKRAVGDVLASRAGEVAFFTGKQDAGLAGRLAAAADTGKPFARMTYTRAVEVLQASGEPFKAPVAWGEGLASEHERWLAEKHVQGPVFVTDYPAAIKPFYMKRNAGDAGTARATVQAFDLLVPSIVSGGRYPRAAWFSSCMAAGGRSRGARRASSLPTPFALFLFYAPFPAGRACRRERPRGRLRGACQCHAGGARPLARPRRGAGEGDAAGRHPARRP